MATVGIKVSVVKSDHILQNSSSNIFSTKQDQEVLNSMRYQTVLNL